MGWSLWLLWPPSIAGCATKLRCLWLLRQPRLLLPSTFHASDLHYHRGTGTIIAGVVPVDAASKVAPKVVMTAAGTASVAACIVAVALLPFKDRQMWTVQLWRLYDRSRQ